MSASAEAVKLVLGFITVFNSQQDTIGKLTAENAQLKQDLLKLQATLAEAMQNDAADATAIADIKEQLRSKQIEFDLFQAGINEKLASEAANEEEFAAAMEELRNQIEVLSKPVELQPESQPELQPA
ncbi:MAG: hypothetical protein KME13_23290 [Myxacorys californica WJT36-NPBG1]|jgi:Tfp pilus assembly protein PilO|nr:hypothetical protein [Myxacorys californica WJT36-NPBG1]